MIHFDPTINLSTLVEAGVLVVAAFRLWHQIDKRLTALELRLEPIFLWWSRKEQEEHGSH